MARKVSVGRTAKFETYLRKPIQSNGEIIPALRLVPFSEHPEKQRWHERLLALGWRFHHETCEWFDLSDPDRAEIPCGRLCYLPDFSDAWIQPPGPAPKPGHLARLPEPIRPFD